MNRRRSEAVGEALALFASVTRARASALEQRDEREIATDFLADLAHYCDRHSLTLQGLLSTAEQHYLAETAGQGTQLGPA